MKSDTLDDIREILKQCRQAIISRVAEDEELTAPIRSTCRFSRYLMCRKGRRRHENTDHFNSLAPPLLLRHQ